MKTRLLGALVGLAISFALPTFAQQKEPTLSEQEQAEKTAVDHALRDYSDAFGRGDLSAIGQHCNVPFVVISSQAVKVLPTMSEIEAFYGGLLRDLRERGYSHSIVSELHVKLLDQIALASGVFVRHKTDGSELETIGATYVLRKAEGEWKIAVVWRNPPANVIRAD
jgi:ketosteroid isomerase-like protein